MDSYDEMTGISTDEDSGKDIDKISLNSSEAVEQMLKLIRDDFPILKISGPNGTKGIRYYSIQMNGKNMLILEDHCDKRTKKGLLTTPEKIKKEDFINRGYNKLNWADVFYGDRYKYDTTGKSVNEIKIIFNHLITYNNI